MSSPSSAFADDDDHQPATRSAAGSEDWVVLYDEEVVVTTRRVPRERVRLRTHTATEDREITKQLRKEQIEVSDPRRAR
jgi:stress response protein YsnF